MGRLPKFLDARIGSGEQMSQLTNVVERYNAADGEFEYLVKRIESASFSMEPFRHLLLADFLSPNHLALITGSEQIRLPAATTHEELLEGLDAAGYSVEPFPGCTTDVVDYLRCINAGEWPVGNGVVEGFGLAMRLRKIREPLLERLVAFLNGERFQCVLAAKFDVVRPTRIETAIQKYLTGYEISPHPDIRSKCLTYLLNINTHAVADELSIHTHLLRFKHTQEFLYSFWESNPEFERFWVPWEWCTTETVTSANNSILLFAAHDRSLHAVKLKYDHLNFQRTQIYGNLWYTDVPFLTGNTLTYKQFDFQVST